MRSIATFFVLLILFSLSSAQFYYEDNLNVTDCHLITSCGDCAAAPDCLWCMHEVRINAPVCANASYMSDNVCNNYGWCNGDSCTCSLFPSANSIGSMVVMVIIYGLFLGYAAKMIADGSELLLEIFPNWGTIIGGLLLPVLGAVPDGAMILVSGAFGPADEAQEQVAVGMGTLAGSTIMLLTLPWSASLFVGRCDIHYDETIDSQLTHGLGAMHALKNTGITVDRDTMINARIALLSSLSFWIVQIVAFLYIHDPTGALAHEWEGRLSIAGFIVCSLAFVAYCIYQIIVPKLAEKRQKKAEELAAARSIRLRALHVLERMKRHAGIAESPKEVHVTEEAKVEKSNAAALAAGLKWKRKVTEKTPDVNTSLLPTNNQSINETAKSVEEEEEKEPFLKVLLTSLALMIAGAGLVAFFSDPMVDVLSNLGYALGIPAFYVSFLITPFCSNASELIASIVFAAKKTTASASMTYSQLYGAATMNCTFGLAIFYALIYFRGLVWNFSAETMSILFVTWAVCGMGSFFKTLRLWFSIPNMLLYPLSLVLVYVLETYGGIK